jgi:hypothetical protein
MRAAKVFVVLALAWTSSLAGASAAPPGDASNAEESGVLPSPQDLETDLALIAESHGWTIEQARERHRVSESLGAVLDAIARERPDAYIGAALGEEPGDPHTLYLKGPADAFISELAESVHADVLIADNQPYSFEELEARKLRVHHALEDLGFRYGAVAINITGAGVIPATVTAEPGLSSSPSEILKLLPADLRDSVDLTIRPDIAVRDFSAFGGMWMRDLDDPDPEQCTSGWSVVDNSDGVGGITTAAHCPGIDKVWHYGHGAHPVNYRGQHFGQWGDVKWYGVPNESEPDDFYADEDSIRDVTGIKPRTQIMVNDSACVYGRNTNFRNCSLDVEDESIGCWRAGREGPVFVDRLVAMDGIVSDTGDSGGGWSLVNQAWGSVVGVCPIGYFDHEVWSVADLYDEGMGVRVKCGC